MELQERFRNGGFNDGCSGRRRRQKWRFDLCPQMQWRPKYVRISNTALRSMLKKLARSNDDIKETLDTIRREEVLLEDQWEKDFQYWDCFFNLKKVLRQGHRADNTKKRFGNSISTDGIGLSAIVESRKSPLDQSILKLRDKMKESKSLLLFFFFLSGFFCYIW